jgi:RNA polymerase primary sigma factor
MKKQEARLFAEFGRYPTDEELAEATGLSVRRLEELRGLPQTISLSLVVGDDDDLELGDTLADPAEQFEETVTAISPEEILSLLEQTLNPREYQVVSKRFGLEGKDERKLAQVGRELGISRERVRQIEARALSKLRNASQIAALAME